MSEKDEFASLFEDDNPEEELTSLFDDDKVDSNPEGEVKSVLSELDDELGDFSDSFDPGDELKNKDSNNPMEDDFSLEDPLEDNDSIDTNNHNSTEFKTVPNPEKTNRRTSSDFKPDMDALLITAQSSMIIEGMKVLTLKQYNKDTRSIYVEAIQGIDLFIKILERNPENYFRLSTIINEDIDCAEIERLSKAIYKSCYRNEPETDSQKLIAYKLFRNRLYDGYKKSSISSAIVLIRKYFRMSGALDDNLVNTLLRKKDSKLIKDITKIEKNSAFALSLIKAGENIIKKELKGKDTYKFIIDSNRLLFHYFNSINNLEKAIYHKKIYELHKNYLLVKD